MHVQQIHTRIILTLCPPSLLQVDAREHGLIVTITRPPGPLSIMLCDLVKYYIHNSKKQDSRTQEWIYLIVYVILARYGRRPYQINLRLTHRSKLRNRLRLDVRPVQPRVALSPLLCKRCSPKLPASL